MQGPARDLQAARNFPHLFRFRFALFTSKLSRPASDATDARPSRDSFKVAVVVWANT